MSPRFLVLGAVAMVAAVASVRADELQGTYTAVDTVPGTYAPYINDDGSPSFLNSPFSESLTVGTPLTTTFLQVSPVSGSGSVGTVTGSIAIAMTLTGPNGSAVTGLTYSSGGNGATLSKGTIDFNANYELAYASQTDCLTWNSKTCTPSNSTTTLGETLTATLANGEVVKIGLYNWGDWNMTPEISFEEMSGPSPVQPVPEPASIAVFGAGFVGLGFMRRRWRTIGGPLLS